MERAGAGSIAIATNRMHRVADDVEAAVGVPLVHIADAVAETARGLGATTIGIVGTRWVMAERFYADRFARHGIAAVVPPTGARAELDRIVFDELTRGIVTDASRAAFRDAFAALEADGADATALARIALGERSAGALAPELLHRVEHRADGGHALGAVPVPQGDGPA